MDPDEHFEDFTTASDWELFTAKLEQVLTEWMGKPSDNEYIVNNWQIIHEKILFADFQFKFSYYKQIGENPFLSTSASTYGLESLSNSSSSSNIQIPPYLHGAVTTEFEFPPRMVPHVIAEYFNLKEFAVLSSAGLEPVSNESKLKVLLSSSCIALNNTNCNFPIMVQYHHWSQSYFSGIAEFSGIRTTFNMVMLRQTGNLPTHLSGLLDVFKSKIGTHLQVPVGVSAHFFYKMKNWDAESTLDSFPPELFELIKNEQNPKESKDIAKDEAIPEWIQYTAHLSFLPFGSLEDPFLHLDFVSGWPSLTEDIVVDSASYSDLEPETAQEWFFSIKTDSNAEYRLKELVEGIWNLRSDWRTVEQVLGKTIEENKGSLKFSTALEKITRNGVPNIPVASISRVLNRAQRQVLYNPDSYDDLPPLSPEQIDLVVQFLFPDSCKTGHNYNYPSSFNNTRPIFQKESINALLETLAGVKSAPVGSLIWRLSIIIGYLFSYGGSSAAVAYVWAEFILELRYRVDNSIKICGLESGSPNSATCLMNQKLQMLNCCIDKKISREELAKKQHSKDPDKMESGCEESDDDDDEFFDCEENLEEVSKLNKPSGRQRKNGRLFCIKTGEPMYIPITQNPGPLTEDVMEEQSKILIELGDDAQASEVRAKMMSASLFSDMESFKAANPGAELEDFVRWYSPRDWIESEETDEFGNKVGFLSPRMKVPGNLWLEVWLNAQPIPARRQKRLFDDTKEAEKILHWLGNRTLCDISSLLFPCLSHAATLKVLEETDKLSFEYKVPSNFLQTLVQLSRSFSCVLNPNNDFSELTAYKTQFFNLLTQSEKEITQIKSFQQKFPTIDVQELFCRKETDKDVYGNDFLPNFIKVEGEYSSVVLKLIKDMFQKEMLQSNPLLDQSSDFKFGKPFKRVFVLKYNPQKSSESNNLVTCFPQRLSCLLTDDKITLAGTFSSKTDLS